MDEIPAFSNLKNFQNYPSLPESIQEFLQYAYSENKEKKINKATSSERIRPPLRRLPGGIVRQEKRIRLIGRPITIDRT